MRDTKLQKMLATTCGVQKTTLIHYTRGPAEWLTLKPDTGMLTHLPLGDSGTRLQRHSLSRTSMFRRFHFSSAGLELANAAHGLDRVGSLALILGLCRCVDELESKWYAPDVWGCPASLVFVARLRVALMGSVGWLKSSFFFIFCGQEGGQCAPFWKPCSSITNSLL